MVYIEIALRTNKYRMRVIIRTIVTGRTSSCGTI